MISVSFDLYDVLRFVLHSSVSLPLYAVDPRDRKSVV